MHRGQLAIQPCKLPTVPQHVPLGPTAINTGATGHRPASPVTGMGSGCRRSREWPQRGRAGQPARSEVADAGEQHFRQQLGVLPHIQFG